MRAAARKREPLPEGLRLEIVVPGVPVPAARPRAVPLVVGGRPVLKNGRPIIRAFTPPATLAYENMVELYARKAAAANPDWQRVVDERHAVRVSMLFVRAHWRGDIDNLVKAPLDALNNAATVWFDDNRVVELYAEVRTDPSKLPKLELVVEPVNYSEPLWAKMAAEAGWLPPTARNEETKGGER